jgi:zinc transporter ZupT
MRRNVNAMALHFIVVDYGLRTHHKDIYNRKGRWLLALAVLIGWGIGVLTEIPEAALALLFAFLSGGIILNVLKEELPEDRESSFWAFSIGSIGYVVLLLFVVSI